MSGQIIPKDKLPVRIYTQDFIIEGVAYLPKGGRLSDYINVDRKFLPISEAVVHFLTSGKEIQRMEVLMINRDSVIILIPREEKIKKVEEINGEEVS